MADLPPVEFARLGPARGARIVVTGGCRGIGRRFVEVAHGLGAKLAVIDLPLAIKRHKLPEGVIAIPYDARKDDAAKKAFDRFDIVAFGESWSDGVNFHGSRPGRHWTGIAFELPGADMKAPILPPACLRGNGDSYFGKRK